MNISKQCSEGIAIDENTNYQKRRKDSLKIRNDLKSQSIMPYNVCSLVQQGQNGLLGLLTPLILSFSKILFILPRTAFICLYRQSYGPRGFKISFLKIFLAFRHFASRPGGHFVWIFEKITFSKTAWAM